MNITDALERINAIHEHLAKAEVYRGYHPLLVGLSGGCGLLAAAVQPWFVEPVGPVSFLRYWLLVGAGCALLASSPTLLRGLLAEDSAARRRTLTVGGQFLPCLLAGAAVTLALSRLEIEGAIALLPGLWALFFGLGIVASRPYLPRSAAWVAGWYLVVGLVVLLGATGPAALSGWTVGVPFGVGQLWMALVFRSARRSGETEA
jgi:hypothetical protein